MNHHLMYCLCIFYKLTRTNHFHGQMTLFNCFCSHQFSGRRHWANTIAIQNQQGTGHFTPLSNSSTQVTTKANIPEEVMHELSVVMSPNQNTRNSLPFTPLPMSGNLDMQMRPDRTNAVNWHWDPSPLTSPFI